MDGGSGLEKIEIGTFHLTGFGGKLNVALE
jgi:hypothetical protein